ncbi:MAG: 3-isopropylmalate dehydratase large subunit, partial [Mesorhizobium sp.]
QGIYHVVGPEQGLTLPGLVIAATDSHVTTHGALGALCFGVGYEAATQVLATDTLWHDGLRSMLVSIDGVLPAGVSAKDLALQMVRVIGAKGGTGYCVEFAGQTVAMMGIEGRMTLCNMGVEAGARAALIAPDHTTIEYVSNRPHAPKGAMWD